MPSFRYHCLWYPTPSLARHELNHTRKLLKAGSFGQGSPTQRLRSKHYQPNIPRTDLEQKWDNNLLKVWLCYMYYCCFVKLINTYLWSEIPTSFLVVGHPRMQHLITMFGVFCPSWCFNIIPTAWLWIRSLTWKKAMKTCLKTQTKISFLIKSVLFNLLLLLNTNRIRISAARINNFV